MPLVEQTCVLFMKMGGRPYNHDSLSSAAWLKSQNTARFSAPGAQTLRALEPPGLWNVRARNGRGRHASHTVRTTKGAVADNAMNESCTNITCIQKPPRGGFRAAPISASDAARITASVFNTALFAASAPDAAREDAADEERADLDADELDLAKLVKSIDEDAGAPAAATRAATVTVRDARAVQADAQHDANAFPAAAAEAALSDAGVDGAAPSASSEPSAFSAKRAESAADRAPAAADGCTYRDCIAGRAGLPQGPLGMRVFQILMVGGMVTFMATINGLLHQGLGFFAHALWMYPLVFCISFLVRTFIGGKIVDAVAPRLVLPHTRGIARSVAMTLLNVVVMGTIMGFIVTLLMSGTQDYLATVAATLPISLVAAALVNYFIVSPAVRMICANVIEPGGNARIVTAAQKYAMPWAAIFSN